MKIIRFKPFISGSLRAVFSVQFSEIDGFPENFIIESFSYFEKDGKSWVSFPGRKYTQDGEIKHFSFNRFAIPKENYEFLNKVKEEVLRLYPNGIN